MSSRRRYYIFVGFIYGLEEKNWKSEVVFAVNVMLNLSNIFDFVPRTQHICILHLKNKN